MVSMNGTKVDSRISRGESFLEAVNVAWQSLHRTDEGTGLCVKSTIPCIREARIKHFLDRSKYPTRVPEGNEQGCLSVVIYLNPSTPRRAG